MTRDKYFSLYKRVSSPKLDNKGLVIIKVTGKKFGSFCNGFTKPYDIMVEEAFRATAYQLTHVLPRGAILFLCHFNSEIIAILDPEKISNDYLGLDSQKICSSVTSHVTRDFNAIFAYLVRRKFSEPITGVLDNEALKQSPYVFNIEASSLLHDEGYMETLTDVKRVVFGGRAFNIPKEELSEYITWFQLKCNAEAHHRLLYLLDDLRGERIPVKAILEILEKRGVDPKDYPDWYYQGTWLRKVELDEGYEWRYETIPQLVPNETDIYALLEG